LTLFATSTIGGNMASHSVGSRAALIDSAPFPALRRLPAGAGAMPAASSGIGSAPKFAKDPGRALLACALWLHVGFVGALSAAAGVVLLLSGDTAALPALCVAGFGGAIALLGWRRGRSVLERRDLQARLDLTRR
jgi:hypothetical protein